MLIIDFETRSPVDLKKHGTYKYATARRTEIICCSVLTTGSWVNTTWLNPAIYPRAIKADNARVLTIINDYVKNARTLVAAHSAQFDRLIYEYIAEPDHKFPYIEYNRWYCTSALARVNALPGKLADVTRALNSHNQKDHRGAALIRKHCIPNDDGTYDEDQHSLNDLARYCEQDVRATASVINACRPMTKEEHQDWLLCEDINERGVRIDTTFAKRAISYATVETQEIAYRLASATQDKITKHTQTARIKNFVAQELTRAEITTEPMVRYKDGVKKYSIDKAVRAELLGRAEELDIPANVLEVLQLTDDGNRSSVSKYAKMLDMANTQDQRVRGAFVFAGAGQTKRYTSRGLQLHNTRRDCWSEEHYAAIKAQMRGDDSLSRAAIRIPRTKEVLVLPSVMDTLSKALRPTLIPAPGSVFVVGDWSAVEALALPWLTATPEGDRRVAEFKHAFDHPEEPDVYAKTATTLGFDDRQIGKVADLSLGYGGGAGAFKSMARNYGIAINDSRVQSLIHQWRRINSWGPAFWGKLRKTAMYAIGHPGQPYQVGMLAYHFYRELLGGTLACTLPDGSTIQYPQARIEIQDGPYGPQNVITALKASWSMAADATEWPRVTLWHGLLAENVTQAFCAALLRHAIRRLETERGDGDVVMHVHDEIVLEVSKERAYAAKARLTEVMMTPPAYALTLPLRAEVSVRNRYGK